MGGGDWYDASVDHLEVQDSVDLDAEKELWWAWYHKEYRPKLNTPEQIEMVDFVDWLINKGVATRTNKVEEYWD